MANKDNRMMRRRLINALLSSIASISLVLLLTGVAALLLVNAGSVADYFKENLQITVLMKQEVGESRAMDYQKQIEELPYVRQTRLVTREQGTAELSEMLGPDFLSVFESSPVPVSVEVTLEADYVVSDSLEMVIPHLEESPLVDVVECRKSLVDALNSNLSRISAILGAFILLLLFISVALISNTVRLNVFAQRFNIHTMKLVGATRSFIMAPFLVRAVLQGLASGALALCMLSALLLLLRHSFEQLFSLFSKGAMVLTAFIVMLSGVAICLVSTWLLVGKLIRMDKNELYY